MTGTLKALALIQAPLVLMQLVCLVYKSNTDMDMNIDMVEYFAGCMAVSWVMHMSEVFHPLFIVLCGDKNLVVCTYRLGSSHTHI